MIRTLAAALFVAALPSFALAADPAPMPHAKTKVAVGEAAPTFTIKDAAGKTVNLADLTAKGPVLVRLTCGCSGCDKELAYFQKINEVYKDKGLISLYVFKEPDAKMAKYATERKIDVLYAVDTKGDSWGVFQTKSMPTNILIDKGGKIVSIAAGCDPSGLLANVVSEKTGKLLGTDPVDVKNKVEKK
ncbi:MAG: peroxiredoxin family protein [Gemmata sp.]|jgi:peroxiredoxin